MPKFHWKDLEKWIDGRSPGSRRAIAILWLLEGQKIDLGKIPKRSGAKKPSIVRHELIRLLKKHEGVQFDGDLCWIPELCTEDT